MNGIRCDPTEPAEPVDTEPASNRGRGPEPAAPARFADFFRAEHEWARRLAFVLTGSAETADDLAQEAFARLCPRYDRLENPRAYLRVVVVNLARRHRRVARDAAGGELVDAAAATLGAASIEILDLVDRLPSRQRAVLVLRYFEGLSEREIASVLSCRPGTVKSLAARALARLREELER